MLANIHVKNFALIDEADIELTNNLNILTGETGAGKSILLGAIGLALGARTPKDTIRTNSDYALSELTFTDINEAVKACAVEEGFEVSEDEIVITRKLMANGRSILRINGETASASQVKMLAAELIDIYGQNEYQTLLDSHKQLDLVDRFAGEDAEKIKECIREEYKKYRALKDEENEIDLDVSSRKREIDLLEYEINEIEEAAVKEDEEESLKSEHKLLANSRIIAETLGKLSEGLYGDNGCSDLIADSLRSVSRVSDVDEKLAQFYDMLSDIDSKISDLNREVSDYLYNLPDSAERLNEVEIRLDLISALKLKYGNSVAEINNYLEEIREKLEKLYNFESYVEKLNSKILESENRLSVLCAKLKEIRQKNSKQLAKKITEALIDLNFNMVKFDIEMTDKDEFTANGTDNVSFVISLNPGEEQKPIAKVASGGEMSRIMLAIKSVLASKDEIGTLIFDEIDAGISGRTAQMVSEKLASISQRHQVICITHLPQIAAMADAHFYIEKTVVNNGTSTHIQQIKDKAVTGEIARLIGGARITESILESAAEMTLLADKRKTEIREK